MDVKIEAFAATLQGILADYRDDVVKASKNAVDVVADKAAKEIKGHTTFKEPTGQYKKAFRLKTIYESAFAKRKLWYVKAPHYRLTHLLEYGHQKRNGGKTNAYPHIVYGEKYAQENLLTEIKKGVEKI